MIFHFENNVICTEKRFLIPTNPTQMQLHIFVAHGRPFEVPHQIKVIYSLIASNISAVPFSGNLSFFFFICGQSDTDDHLPCESPALLIKNISSKT